MTKQLKQVLSDLKRALRLFLENDLLIHSGNSALYLITAIFPFLMMMLTVINYMPNYSPENLIELLDDIFPSFDAVKSLVVGIVYRFKAQSSGLMLSISALFMLWTASSGLSALQAGLVKLRRDHRPWVKNRLLAILFTVALSVSLPFALVMSVFGKSIVLLLHQVEQLPELGAFADRAVDFLRVNQLLSAWLLFPALLALYAWLPGGHSQVRSLLPGTLLSGTLCLITTNVFALFISRFYKTAVIYGPFASLFLMILWLRVIMIFFFYGACVNCAVEERRLGTAQIAR